MEAQSDNSTEQSSNESSHHTGEGVVIDIGTGDGRFVSASARANPNKFYIGVDANAKPLEKLSIKVTRKPAKRGLTNAMFVQAAIEDLPAELDGAADEIHIHFPWGSLLRAVAIGDSEILKSLRRICAPGGLLEVLIGVDSDRDRTELERLDIPDLTPIFLHSYMFPKYLSAGFQLLDQRKLKFDQWSKLETSWAKKLSPNVNRVVTHLLFEAK